MKPLEWKEALDEHTETADIHRTIHVSTATPTSSDGKDGDIWFVVEA